MWSRHQIPPGELHLILLKNSSSSQQLVLFFRGVNRSRLQQGQSTVQPCTWAAPIPELFVGCSNFLDSSRRGGSSNALLFNATSTWGSDLQLPDSTENHSCNFWMFWRRVILLERALCSLPDPFSALLCLNISPRTDASQTQSHASWMAPLEIIALTGTYIIPYNCFYEIWKMHYEKRMGQTHLTSGQDLLYNYA